MRRFFVVGVDPINKEQTESIRNWMKEQGVGWWHWIDGMWLVTTNNQNISVASIRNLVCDVTNDATNLVVEIEPKTWSGYGPSGENRNMFDWLRRNWKK